ncbi:recombinase family protein [Daejeonella sp.]|uniref:recombinase family protein n=1 Tax=Daejeonella sp. TaxID=2805397 RepID=UPI0030BA62C6
MKTADLYIRVSTDEQADRGYSQRNQQEVLLKYCEINSIEVRKVVFEDYSAKTFNRPAWNGLLTDIKKGKGKSQIILFTKWDRFSRNAGDAYGMINTLRKLGIEPQAVEQPLDLSIPENKMMLAFYLAAPEVENDRRALNTFYGMRRARKEGRWMGAAPVGYANRINPAGRKYIEPNYPKAEIMKWVFEVLSKGTFAADQIRKMANQKGLNCDKSNFWRLIRNPVYCGLVTVSQYKDEDATYVQGDHEPIITQAMFYKVQDILDGKKRKIREKTRMVSDEELPLRGFMHCPNCNRMLTGSASKGRHAYYYYYHCSASCGCRFKAEETNKAFLAELKKFSLDPAFENVFKDDLLKKYKELTTGKNGLKKQIINQITDQSNKMTKARELLLTGDIDPSDYKTIKSECEKRITVSEAELADTSANQLTVSNMDKLLEEAMTVLKGLDSFYEFFKDINVKRDFIGSMFPEKFTFDGSQHRTANINEALEAIYLYNSELDGIKKGKNSDFKNLSLMVARRGIEPLFPE